MQQRLPGNRFCSSAPDVPPLNSSAPFCRRVLEWYDSGEAEIGLLAFRGAGLRAQAHPAPPCCVHVILEIPEIENNTAQLSFHSQPAGSKETYISHNNATDIVIFACATWLTTTTMVTLKHSAFCSFYNGDKTVFLFYSNWHVSFLCRRIQSTKRTFSCSVF